MTTPLKLALDSERPEWARALVASLPASLRLAPAEGADFGLVDAGAAWPLRAEAMVACGIKRVLVVEPTMADPDAVQRLSEVANERGAMIRFGEGFAGNPALTGFRSWLTEDIVLLTATGHGEADVASLLLQQLRLARAAIFSAERVEDAVITTGAAIVTLAGDLDGRPGILRMNVCRTEAVAAQHRLLAHGPVVTASLTVHDGWNAREAEAAFADSDGLQVRPSIYESAHRAALRALLDEQAQAGEDLQLWAKDAAFVRALCSDH